MTLTFNQKIAIVLVALGVLTTGSTATDLATLIGPGVTKSVIALANIIQTMLAGFLAVVTGQSNLIRDVQQMPGVEKITVNEKASPVLAQLAVDPEQLKIEPTAKAEAAVTATANTANGFRMKNVLVIGVMCLVLAGCNQTAQEVAASITSVTQTTSEKVKSAQGYAVSVCGYLPAAASVIGIFNSGYSQNVATVGGAICNAISSRPLADGPRSNVYVNGVRIKGDFVK